MAITRAASAGSEQDGSEQASAGQAVVEHAVVTQAGADRGGGEQAGRPLHGTSTAGVTRRPRELQDRLNVFVYHPLAWRLALALARTPATPNMVSVAGALLVAAAGAAYAWPAWPWSALIGLGLHLGWHVVDGADGDLARLTGRSGPRGEVVDGLCDYAGHIVLYLVLGTVLQHQIGWPAWLLAVASGAGRVVQATHYESERRQYQWRVYDLAWLRVSRGADAPPARGLVRGYLALAARLVPGDAAVDAALAGAARDPRRRERMRAIVRRAWLRRPWSFDLLRSNQRTLALGASMLAGSPLYYFVYESVLLNLVLVRSIAANARAERAMAAACRAAASEGAAAWTR